MSRMGEFVAEQEQENDSGRFDMEEYMEWYSNQAKAQKEAEAEAWAKQHDAETIKQREVSNEQV